MGPAERALPVPRGSTDCTEVGKQSPEASHRAALQSRHQGGSRLRAFLQPSPARPAPVVHGAQGAQGDHLPGTSVYVVRSWAGEPER